MNEKKKIPVIIDTDIGDDIDDTWALVFALLSESLDIKLVTTVLGDPIYRANLIAKLNESCGKGHIDIGLCRHGERPTIEYQGKWVEDYALSQYPGRIYDDGVDRMIEIVKQSDETVTVLALGPCTNLAEAVKRYPEFAEKVRVVGVFGSINVGYFGSEPCAEYNVVSDVEAAKIFLSSYKDIIITPIDTCFDAVLDGERYACLLNSRKKNGVLDALLTNFEIWGNTHPHWKDKKFDHTSELCDTVAVYMILTNKGLVNEKLKLIVDDSGKTLVDESGSIVEAALKWDDLDYFLDYLTDAYCRAQND